jgi:hypothetical protein
MTGGSGSVVGSVGIGSESIVVMLLVWRGALTGRTARAAPERFARSHKDAASAWTCGIGKVKVHSHGAPNVAGLGSMCMRSTPTRRRVARRAEPSLWTRDPALR